MKRKIYNLIQDLLILLIFISGMFIVFQVVKKILGGSLEVEDILLGFVIFNMSCTFVIVFNLAQLRSDHNHLSKQFYYITKDFKEFKQKI